MLTKHWNYALPIAGVLSAMLLAGCVDESYDLSDIDTTMKFEVNDLALPLNLAPVEFESVVDLSNEECIDTINGEYVLVKDGTFESDEIKIRDIQTEADIHLTGSVQDIPAIDPSLIDPSGDAPEVPMDKQTYEFSYTYDDVDEYIKRIDAGDVDLTIALKIHSQYDNDEAIKCNFRDLKFILPKGFYGDVLSNGTKIDDITREKPNNEVTVTKASTNSEGDYVFSFHVTSFDYKESGARLENKLFYLSTSVVFEDGYMSVENPNGNPGQLSTSFDVSELHVTSFSGRVYYKVDNLDPEDLELNDLPDLLTDKETKISIKNPQLYVKLSNPLVDEKNQIEASTGVKISQIRPAGEEIITSSLSKRLEIKAIKDEQKFCLSPIEGFNQFIPEFSGAESYLMNRLDSIVYGDGLPEGLHIEFLDPMMDTTEVKNFKLGRDLGKVHGDYKFFAPLDLGEGSQIYYSDEATDWRLSSEDDQLNIKKLSINADVVSELPVAVRLHATPLDDKGNEIDVHVDPVDIPAGCKNLPITIKMEGDIVNLDGMKYTIVVKAGENTQALKPTQHLTLNNLKVRVSGSYIVKDEDK